MSSNHMWGDKDFDWKALGDAIEWFRDEFERLKIEVSDVKEKFGQLRAYVTLGPGDEAAYRAIYEAGIKKWPHIKAELLDAADFPEYLEGL